MRRTEHLGARALAVVGLLATLCYLVWRAVFSMSGTHLWLSLPTFAFEVVGFIGAGCLTWGLWPMPGSGSDPARPAVPVPVSVDVVVRVDQQPEHEVRSTLLAVGSVRGTQNTVIVDVSGRPSIAALAAEFGAVYAATDPADQNGVRVMLAAVRSESFLLLDAGDIPTHNIVEQLSPDLVDRRTAVVQGMSVSLAEESAEHGPNGRHELLFERSSLNPALGSRGSAIWLGTGSLVRTESLRDIEFEMVSALEAQWRAGVALLSAGWRITAPGLVPVVAHRTVHSEHAVAEDRVQRARAARHIVFGRSGVLRSRSFTAGQRVATLAWAVRPLSGLRRVVFLVLLGSAILAGAVPFHASATVLVCGWLPAFLYTSLGLALLSGWTLRPGDRARWSLHSMGAGCRSLRPPHIRQARRAPIVAIPSPQYGAGLVVAVVGLSVVLVLRGISDRVTHTLGVLPQRSLMGLLVVTLWTLGMSLDLLRVLGRRGQLRRSARVVSSLPATLGERSVSIVDMTPLGAGVVSQTAVDVNERLLLDSVIPTRSGVTTMHVPCVVRNVSRHADGDFRIGVEFGDVNEGTANALAEFCVIEPVWERMKIVPPSDAVPAPQVMYVNEPVVPPTTGRVAVRLVSLLALAGAVASAVPATADASAPSVHHLSGIVVMVADPLGDPTATTTIPGAIAVETTAATTTAVTTIPVTTIPDSTGATTGEPTAVAGALVVAVCSLEPGADGEWGTSDDVYDAPVSVLTDSDGGYQLDLVGEACWATVAPPDALTDPDGAEVAVEAVDVSSATTTNQRVVLPRRSAVATSTGPTTEGASLAVKDGRGLTVARVSGDAVSGLRFEAVVGKALPTPDATQLAHTQDDRSTMSLFVLAIVAVLALSILLGLVHPRAVQPQPLRDS